MRAQLPKLARVLSAFAVAALTCARASAAETGEISAEMRAADTRLERRVSLRADRWYVGELCEHIARLAGVPVSAHDRDGAADPRVIAILNDMTLADAMNALRSLLSYEGAPYIWDRRGQAPSFSYVLCRSLKAQRLAGEITARVQADFEAECSKLLQMCRLSDDDLRRLAGTDPLADNMVKFPRVQAAWQMLGDVVSPDALAGVLRGERTLTLSVADLPPSGRRFVDRVWSEGRRYILTPEGGRAEAPEPDRVYVHTDRAGPSAATSLFIGLPHAGEYAYAGGVPLARRTLQVHMPEWVLDSDRAKDPREDALVPRPSPEPPEPAKGPTLAFRLGQLADAVRISIICRIPAVAEGMTGPVPYGRTPAQYLDALGRRYGLLQTKWNGATLLVTSSGWSWHEPQQLTWLMEKGLRRSLARKDGMSFHEVVQLAASLNEHQSQTVGTDHPSLSFLRRPGLFAELGREPGLAERALSAEGIPLVGPFAELIARKAGADAPSRVSAFRFVEKNMVPVTGDDGKITFAAGQGHLWWMELRQPDGSWLPHSATRRPREVTSQ